MKTLATLLTLALLTLAVGIIAGDIAKHSADKHQTFTGKLVCLGCDLKKAEGARSACSVHGHDHALKTKDGKYVNFLANQYSSDLLKGEKYHNKDMSVHGVYFKKANVLDVESFTVGDRKMGWCGGCKSMDHCAYAEGEKKEAGHGSM